MEITILLSPFQLLQAPTVRHETPIRNTHPFSPLCVISLFPLGYGYLFLLPVSQLNFRMVLDSSPHFPSSTSLLQLCPSDATFPRECSCWPWIWRAPRKACSDLSLPPSLTHISPGPGREGKHQASVSYQFRGAGTRGFPTGLSLALH